MIYFIQNTETLNIKIGYSDRVAKRLSQLQVGNSQKLRLLFQMEGDRTKEKELHQRYRNKQLRGEWYNKEVLESFLSD
jgi:hypothetical protein